MGITDRISSLFSGSDKEKREGTRSPPDVKKLRKTQTRAAKASRLTRFRNLSQDIDPGELKRAYKYESCTHKAINKRAEDCFEKWFEVAAPEDEELPDGVGESVQELIERTGMKKVFPRIMRQAQILGHGYGEIVYANDDADVSEEPNGDYIEDIVLIDSESIGPAVDQEVGSDTHGEITHYVQKMSGQNKEIEIHPDRIISFPWVRVGTEEQGVPAIQPVFNVVKSKILLDQLTGDIPQAMVSQIISINIDGANEDEIDEWFEKLEDMENAGRFVGSDKHEFEVKDSTEGLNIDPYTEHAVQQLATGLGVPKTLMLGAGAGEIATAQVNLKDYYSDIRNIQKRFESVIREIIDKEFGLQGIDENYEIDWNELYTQDEKESEILLNKARAANQLANPIPILDNDEIREEIFDLEPREEGEANEGVGDDYV